ncbi:UNVERIFIED_CONTAM: hypothetical protein DQE83_14960 [Escherichia coli]
MRLCSNARHHSSSDLSFIVASSAKISLSSRFQRCSPLSLCLRVLFFILTTASAQSGLKRYC